MTIAESLARGQVMFERYCAVCHGNELTGGQFGPALDRAFASGVPYLVNVMTDVDAIYPRSTTGV